jgi:ABC-type transporter Mla subunit MlaD
MSQKANYFKIGVFVIIAVVLGAAGLVLLGLRSRLQHKMLFETYIDESVQGLEIGSPVKYRGVRVGEVREIDLPPREREDLRPHGGRLIYVVMEIVPKALGLHPGEELTQGDLNALIVRGLRVRLAAQGITGVMYIETDYIPGAPAPFEPASLTHLYVPSAPSTFTRFTDAIDAIFGKLEKVDFDRLTQQADQLFASLNHVVEPANVDRILGEVEHVIATAQRKMDELPLSQISTRLDELLAKIDRTIDTLQLEPLRGSLGQFVEEARATNQQLQGVLRDVNVLTENVAGASRDLQPLTGQARLAIKHLNQLVLARAEDIESIMENVRLITEHLKGLSSGAEWYPSQVLFGEQPNPPHARRP